MAEVKRDYLDGLEERARNALFSFREGQDDAVKTLALEMVSLEYAGYMKQFARVVDEVGRDDTIIGASFTNMLEYGVNLTNGVLNITPRHILGGDLAMFNLNVRRLNDFRKSIPDRLKDSSH